MRRNIFYFTLQSNQFERNRKKKTFPIVKSIKFYSFDFKAIVTEKSSVTFCENMVRRKEM